VFHELFRGVRGVVVVRGNEEKHHGWNGNAEEVCARKFRVIIARRRFGRRTRETRSARSSATCRNRGDTTTKDGCFLRGHFYIAILCYLDVKSFMLKKSNF